MSFGRIQSSSGIPGTSRVNSHPYVHLNTPVDGAPQVQGAGSERSSPRYLFSDTEIETLTRNAEEILQLHEHFVEELQAAVSPFGFTMTVSTSGISGDMHNQQKQGIDSAGENVGAAIGAVATVFVTKVCHSLLCWAILH
jgi:hypothetical protein